MKITRTAVLFTCLAGLASCQTETDSAEQLGTESPAAKPHHDCDCPKGLAGSQRPKPKPNERYAVPVADRPTVGPRDALVTMVVFSDFACQHCARFVPTLERLRGRHPDELRLVFRQLPLPFHPHAKPAARAALAAAQQDGFVAMHNLLFERHHKLANADFASWAGELGLDRQRFERDLADPALAAVIEDDLAAARQFGVRGTPSMFINGRFVVGAQPLARLDAMVRDELTEARRFAAANPHVAREGLYAAMSKRWLSETTSAEAL